MSATARLVFDVKKVASSTKKGVVKVVVTSNRKRHYFSTGVYLYKDQWNDKSHVVNSVQAMELNDLLNAIVRKVTVYLRECHEKNREFSAEELSSMLSVGDKKEIPFIDFVEDRVENRPDIKEGTRKHHRVLVDALREYGKMASFSDLTKANILEFYEHIQKRGIRQTTVYNYMKNLKVYVNQAIDRGFLDKDPFCGIRLDRGKNAMRQYLTEEELGKLVRAKITVSPVAKARDLFVWQCYTGMAYADMMAFDYDKDVVERDGRFVVINRRKKSDGDFYLVLMKPALAILEKYGYKLPYMENQPYNDYIKVAVATAGINKSISSHSGRHTFAIMALNNGISMEVVAKILGHADIRTTKVYAKILNTSVDNAFDVLEAKITKKGRK